MSQTRILYGPFAGFPAEVLAQEGEEVRVAVVLFGQRKELVLAAKDVEATAGGENVVARLRGELQKDWDSYWLRVEQEYWLERVDKPEETGAEPLTEHTEWQTILKRRRVEFDAERAAAEAQFDAEVAGDQNPQAAFDARSVHLLPEMTTRVAMKNRWRADEATFQADSARMGRARARRQAAEGAAEELAFSQWLEVVDPAEHRPARLAAAHQRVEQLRDGILSRVRRDWGLELPESFFEFLTIWEGLPEVARAAARRLGFHPTGISDLLNDPAAPPIDDLDPRLHGRYFRDPPEFLTFLHGGDDGLHYGLWFDRPDHCAGVCGYYSNDGIELKPPEGSPTGVLRTAAQDALSGGGEEPSPWALRLLRDACPPEAAVQAEARWQTLDGAGVVGNTPPPPERTWTETEAYRDGLLDGDLDRMIAEAHAACAAGNPEPALVLGRDLHWLGRTEAGPLLVTAYTALGRTALAGIAATHHTNRDLSSVGVLRSPPTPVEDPPCIP